jgi:hypothetical protein
MKTFIKGLGVPCILFQFLLVVSFGSESPKESSRDSVTHQETTALKAKGQGTVQDLSRDYQARSNILKTKKVNEGPKEELSNAVEPDSNEQEMQKITGGSGGGTQPTAVGGSGGKRKYAGDYDPAGTPKEWRGKGGQPDTTVH